MHSHIVFYLLVGSSSQTQLMNWKCLCNNHKIFSCVFNQGRKFFLLSITKSWFRCNISYRQQSHALQSKSRSTTWRFCWLNFPDGFSSIECVVWHHSAAVQLCNVFSIFIESTDRLLIMTMNYWANTYLGFLLLFSSQDGMLSVDGTWKATSPLHQICNIQKIWVLNTFMYIVQWGLTCFGKLVVTKMW